jgi:hypothetical protein
VVNEFPISRAKVTPPPVREETLSRERARERPMAEDHLDPYFKR